MVTVLKPLYSQSSKDIQQVVKKDFLTAIALFGTRVSIRKQQNPADNTRPVMYTVPDGLVFFLCSSSLSVIATGGSTVNAYIFPNNDVEGIFHAIRLQASGSFATTISFSTPLLFNPRETINCNGESATTSYIAAIAGYTIPQQILVEYLK